MTPPPIRGGVDSMTPLIRRGLDSMTHGIGHMLVKPGFLFLVYIIELNQIDLHVGQTLVICW